ncbi:adenosine deaminase CECR1-like [Mizuhopecten yessoensis]|uniref:adenosine deaminase n=1 Tax=Mizuhopecten yessoensis TaxID=6573 RepID=A0A210Q8E6_MIZYE|nr:adenosine deaminase CECR1-like [Mizuhopecten yessoensis]OWF44959.1 Adenosine deaminase AGSA [Mizuhopecten yessoensis]
MEFLVIFTICLITIENVLCLPVEMPTASYLQQRAQIVNGEANMKVGGSIQLSAREQQVNRILMAAKTKEINSSRTVNGPLFLPSIHFFHGKGLIEKSEVFRIIKAMPKGGALHLHDCSMADITWLVKTVTYMDHCYMCTDQNNHIQFHFFQTPPSNPGCPWKLIATERQTAPNTEQFDQMLYNSMSLIVPDPVKTYPTIDVVWKEFLRILDVANGLINYAPVFGKYFYESLKEFHEDNVQYLETRALLPVVYNLDGSTIDNRTWVMETYKQNLDQFLKDYPDFTGARIIRSGLRFVKTSDVLQQVKESIAMLQQYPQVFAGYDLVGQEDPGTPLIDYLGALLYPSQQNIKLPYFFHAGETNWEGTPTDNNLIDAVLLNTSRIGHGYALTKHPETMRLVKNKGIAVEVNPISNQVLKLVDDLRNHPAASLIAQGFPVVISADDPSVWGARGLSYDFYMAFMGLAGADADLAMLKKLAINSLEYSALSPSEKMSAIYRWQYKWEQFIEKTLGNELHPLPFIGRY